MNKLDDTVIKATDSEDLPPRYAAQRRLGEERRDVVTAGPAWARTPRRPIGGRRDVSARSAGPVPGMHTNGDSASAVLSPQGGEDAVIMPAALCLRLLVRAEEIHRVGLKSYGLLIAEPGTPGYPFTATGVVFLDSRKNRRNDPGYRAAFRAQGDYFRQFDDGFRRRPRGVAGGLPRH